MPDRLSREARSRNMAAVGREDTAPERIVRKLLHSLGYRFRLHRRDLPGTPDIVLPKYRLCLFVHGCFWHRHEGCRRASTPTQNGEFWRKKFEKNIERDQEVTRALHDRGWVVAVVWECETKDMDALTSRLRLLLAQPIPSVPAAVLLERQPP